jgi:hypothetical protein
MDLDMIPYMMRILGYKYLNIEVCDSCHTSIPNSSIENRTVCYVEGFTAL